MNLAYQLHDVIREDLSRQDIAQLLANAPYPGMSQRRCLAKMGCSKADLLDALQIIYSLYMPGSKRKPTYRRVRREISKASLREHFTVERALMSTGPALAP